MTQTWSIQEVAARTGISRHTLRYYEKIGLMRDIARAPNGYRRYSPADIEWLAFLQRLKATGMPLAQMRRFAELRSQGDSTAPARRALLEAHRQVIVAQMELFGQCLTAVDAKIERQNEIEARFNRSTPPGDPQHDPS